jgi:imidazolonepropionase-like amidohydrolase
MAALLVTVALPAVAAPTRVDMVARILPRPAEPGPTVKPFVKYGTGTIALTHVRVIDGTGTPTKLDRTLIITGGRITAIGGSELVITTGATVLDLTGRSVLPGIVGMHDHQYYIARPNVAPSLKSDPPVLLPEMIFSSPRLYLGAGVTTLRTAGSVEPYADLNMKRQIDAGVLPGPHMDVTGPYLEGNGSPFLQMHQLRGPDEARTMVEYWADQGVTSFKAYMNITRAELGAAIAAAHARGIKVTGHLCSVTYPEAIALGIDNLEHGFFVNTQLDPTKAPDICPVSGGEPTLLAMHPGDPATKALFNLLIRSRIALTSTLQVFESAGSDFAGERQAALAAMNPSTREDYHIARVNVALRARERDAKHQPSWAALFERELVLERAFATAGGMLIAGPDPTGAGHVVPGFGDQREIELLVKAGFAPLEAIRIGTLNGATYLGLSDRIGSIAVGKNADLVIVAGDPSTRIEDIEKVETVFKDGIGYDSASLLGSVRGRYGQY